MGEKNSRADKEKKTVFLRKADTRWHGALTATAQIIGDRETQQDAVFADRAVAFDDSQFSSSIGVLCDGMGGLSGGEYAGRSAVEGFRAEFERVKSGDPAALASFDMRLFLDKTVRKISEDLFDAGSGSTIAAAIIVDGRAWWVSVGDSRVYAYRGGRLARLTRDHTYALLAGEAAVRRNAEALVSYLGMKNIPIVDICEEPLKLENGDIIMLCSDGVHKALGDREALCCIAENYGALDDMAKKLVDAVAAKSPRPADNASVVLMRFMYI